MLGAIEDYMRGCEPNDDPGRLKDVSGAGR